MKITINLSSWKICKYLCLIGIILALINLGIQIAKYQFNYRQEWMVVFNMDREMNFPTLYSVILLIICASCLKQISIHKKQLKSLFTRHWQILARIFWFLALDEALQIHEIFIFPPVSKLLPGIFHFVWVIPYGLAVIVFVCYFAKFTMSLPKEIRVIFIIAASLYIGGALGMEMLEGAWVRIAGGMQNLIYALIASLEELMEIMGLIVFIYGLLTYITKYQTQILKIQINIIDQHNNPKLLMKKR